MAHRIAVVDDDDGVRAILIQLLQGRGWTVEAYGTFQAALSGLAAAPPDLIIVDVNLPDGCGLDLIGRIRTQSGKTVPAIVLSGLCDEKDIVRGFAAGAIDFIGKPFQRDELIGRCAVQLGRTAAAQPQVQPPASPARPSLPLPLTAGGLIFGRYELVSELGRGGQGCVLLVRDTAREGERLALKVLSPAATRDETVRTRFIRETYALARVRHPGIVVIRDVGAFQGWLYYTMEHVAGPSLRQRISEKGPLAQGEARLLAHGLLRALAALDESRLIHRDLKPENIILRDGSPAQPVIIDFGLARGAADRAITRPDTIIGTPGYVAPEVVRGQDPDHRSDLFGLGLTLRHALTGEDVFPHLSGLRLLEAVARGPIPIPPCSADLEDLLVGLLQTDPRRRLACASDVLAAHPHLDGQAAPDDPTRRVGRPQRISSDSVSGQTWLELQAELRRAPAAREEPTQALALEMDED